MVNNVWPFAPLKHEIQDPHLHIAIYGLGHSAVGHDGNITTNGDMGSGKFHLQKPNS